MDLKFVVFDFLSLLSFCWGEGNVKKILKNQLNSIQHFLSLNYDLKECTAREVNKTPDNNLLLVYIHNKKKKKRLIIRLNRKLDLLFQIDSLMLPIVLVESPYHACVEVVVQIIE